MAAAQVQGVEYYAVPASGPQHPALQVSTEDQGLGDKVCCLLHANVDC